MATKTADPIVMPMLRAAGLDRVASTAATASQAGRPTAAVLLGAEPQQRAGRQRLAAGPLDADSGI